jgi:hypothetical protein
MVRNKKRKNVTKREIRAFAEPRLHSLIAAQAKRKRTGMGAYLLLAAEEKLERDGVREATSNANTEAA